MPGPNQGEAAVQPFLPLEPFPPEAGPSRTRSSQPQHTSCLHLRHSALNGPRLQGYLAHIKKNHPSDPTVALCLGPYGGPRGGGSFL